MMKVSEQEKATMPKENEHLHPSADRVLFNLEDNGYMEGLKCVGPYQHFGAFRHPFSFYKHRKSCEARHQEVEALLCSGDIPDEAKPPLRQIAQSSIQEGACVFWRTHHDSRAEGAPCQEVRVVLSQARDEFRDKYRY